MHLPHSIERKVSILDTAVDRTITHLPTPGDHYSPSTGSAIVTVIYQMTRWHVQTGAQSRVIVGKGTRHDYPVGECIEVPFGPLPSKKQKAIDIALGRIGLGRANIRRTVRPALEALNADYTGAIVAYNSPASMNVFREKCPRAIVALYCQNSLFASYTSSEAVRTLKGADRVICCSGYIKDELQQKLGKQDDRLFTVHNGSDTDMFRPADTVPEGRPRILFVGRVIPDKGPNLLLSAAVNLANKGLDFEIRIVGSAGFNARADLSPFERNLRELANQLGDRVVFVPFQDRVQVINEYRSATIFCAPSNWEDPCPLIVPEGMACGLPVVASRKGGIPEVGQDTVLYFNPPNSDELADQLEKLLVDPALRRDLALRARARAEQVSWKNQYKLVHQALFGETPPVSTVEM